MSDSDLKLDTCDCCEGVKVLTPGSLENVPGLSALVYRVGTHGSFKTTMKARLAGQLALDGLTTRDDDDSTIALLDGWATVLDVLTFYQERIANEGYLRTATERLSILELARSIGYELRPGVAAGAYLAFELETAPGSPGVATIDVGTKVQSLPGPGEKPQFFETVEALEARAEWNALKPQLSKTQTLTTSTKQLYLQGVTTQLQPGDAILIAGTERENSASNLQWYFIVLQTVTPNPDEDYTLVTWEKTLGQMKSGVTPPAQPKVYALRQRAALFGHNAPDPNTFVFPAGTPLPSTMELVNDFSVGLSNQFAVERDSLAILNNSSVSSERRWKNFWIQSNQIDLDVVYPKIVAGGWLVLVNGASNLACKATSVSNPSRAAYSLTGKVTRIIPDVTVNTGTYPLRETAVFAQSELLALAALPVTEPVQGKTIDLDTWVPGLQPNQPLLFSGKRPRAKVAGNANNLTLVSEDGIQSVALKPGDELQVLEPTSTTAGSTTWHLLDREGFEGWVTAVSSLISLQPAGDDDPPASELVYIEEATSTNPAYLTLTLSDPLQNIYDRATLTIYANVARATHGETKSEVLGSGDASQGFQRFVLKQSPLTYVSASTPSGAASTLEVRVNDVLWGESPRLYGLGPRDRTYVTRLSDDGEVTVQFGDGRTGARLPTGAQNVTAVYRAGSGVAGLVKAGQLSLLLTRPLGVKGVINPLAPTGAADPENRDQARENAPLTVLAFERVVSLLDFENFARAFTGIEKAQAVWVWDGETRLVHLTVAGVDGATVDVQSDLYKNLKQAIKDSGDPLQPFRVDSYQSLTFGLEATVLVDSRYLVDAVLAAASAALSLAFSFEGRGFGQPVTAGEVLAVIQGVEGVVAVDLNKLYQTGQLQQLNTRLIAHTARWDQGTLKPAELLTLQANSISLTEMTP